MAQTRWDFGCSFFLLFDAPNKVMALIADDLAFFGDHGVAALGAGVKEFLGFIDDDVIFNHPAKV